MLALSASRGVIISSLALLLAAWLLTNGTWKEAVTTAIAAAAGRC